MTSSMTYIQYKNPTYEALHEAIFARGGGSPDLHARMLLEVLKRFAEDSGAVLQAVTSTLLEELSGRGLDVSRYKHPEGHQVDFRYYVTFDFRDEVNSIRVEIVDTEDGAILFADSLAKLSAWLDSEDECASE